MKITTKGKHAVRVMIDLARNESGYASISEIAQRQDISVKYLEQIISLLVKANLVESMRGATGGYKLTKKTSDYSIKEILDATGDNPKLVSCLEGVPCPRERKCESVVIWQELTSIINDYLEKVSLQDLIDRAYGKNNKK